MRPNVAVLSSAALLALAGSVFAAPRVIVSSTPASSTSAVPGGFADERFATDLGAIFRSPSGNRWVLGVATTLGRRMILDGQGATFGVALIADGSTPLPYSTPATDDPATTTSLNFENGPFAINDSGDLAVNVQEALNLAHVIVKRVGGVWSVDVRQGIDIPYEPTTELFGAGLRPFGLAANGSATFYRANDTDGPLPTTQDDFLSIGSTVFQYGVTPVPGIAGRVFDSLGSTAVEIRSGETAASWIAVGDMSGSTADDEVVIVNGAVVTREGGTIDGLSIRGGGRLGVPAISGDGTDYIHRGQTNASPFIDWVNRTGAVVARTGGPVFAGSPDTWAAFTNFSRTFLNMDVNNAGEFTILGGTLSGGANVARIVFNDQRVLLQDRDAVDLDGDSIADDLFADLNGGTGGELFTHVLGNDGHVYAVVRLVDSDLPGAGTFRGEALVRVSTAGRCNRPVISGQTAPDSACPGVPSDFSVTATATGSLPPVFRWQISPDDGVTWTTLGATPVALPCGEATITGQGTDSPQITVSNCNLGTSALVRCLVSDECGTVISGAAPLSLLPLGVTPCSPVCVPDFNGDTTLNDDDLGEFITSYFEIFAGPGGYAVTPCPDAEPPFDTLGFRADITGDCTLNDDDLGLFITLFFIGCE